ncbi:MAG: TlpA family protein disulfide reductase [Stackebrandtia sp.]
MRLRTSLLALAVLTLAAACSPGGPTDAAAKADWDVPCPKDSGETTAADFEKFTLECLSDGEDHHLGALDDRPMVITLWASWCGPCRAEAPAFKEFHAKMEDKVNLIGVDTQDSAAAAKSFAEDAGWRFPSVIDTDGAVMKSQGITTLPATFFIGSDGKTAVTYNEGELTTEKLLRAAQKHLGVAP